MTDQRSLHKLLSREQIAAQMRVGTTADGRPLFRSDPPYPFHRSGEDSPDPRRTILHRSLYREYFTLYLRHIGDESDREGYPEKVRNLFHAFAGRFLSGDYDFTAAQVPETIARERGWVNPFGWDSVSGRLIEPLTNLFMRAAVHAIDIQYFHDDAVSGHLPLSAFETMVVSYIDGSLKRGGGDTPVYDGIIQTQAQIAQTSIRLRQQFEDCAGRPMTAADWDTLSPSLLQGAWRRAKGGRIDNFRAEAMVSSSPHPFAFTFSGSDPTGFTAVPPSAETVQAYIGENGLEDYIEMFSGFPDTGCPVLAATRRGIGSYVTLVTRDLIAAVRRDFWPETNQTAATCPYHAAQPKA